MGGGRLILSFRNLEKFYVTTNFKISNEEDMFCKSNKNFLVDANSHLKMQ